MGNNQNDIAVEPFRVPKRVLVLGATGTVGRATVAALVAQGHQVVCLVRNRSGVNGAWAPKDTPKKLPGAELRFVDALTPQALAEVGFRGEHFDALVSCLASRTGSPRDAWAIDHQAHVHALSAAQAAGVGHMVLLSAICVQKPLLAFQHAKLAFEKCLIESGINYSIVRPTAFFKSLSGQIERLRRGKPFLLFADGQLTACKPISDADLADLINSLLLIDSTQMPSGLTPGVLIPPRKFNDMTLMRVAAISSSVLCECPRHVAEIIAQLASFEQYSHDCLNKSSEDAHLHAYLSSVSGSARALFESALEMVAKHEQIDLNGLSQ